MNYMLHHEMGKTMELTKRKQNRIPDYDYGSEGAYFVTICTADRKPIFRSPGNGKAINEDVPELTEFGKIAETAIKQIEAHYQTIRLDKYCIMPDHIHMILFIESLQSGRMISAPTVSTVIGSLKRWVSRQIGYSIWQKSYYDRVIRNETEYREIWNYIDGNPLRWLEDNGH